MLFNYVSLLSVLLFTIYCIYYTYQRRKKLTCIAGMMIAMTVGMMSSVAIGVVLGVILNRDITLSTMIAIVVGMIAGYATGKPVSRMAAMDGMMSGIMGGMMGAMLGVMLTITMPIVMFVDLIFIFVMFTLLKLIDEEAGVSRNEKVKVTERKSFFGNPILVIAWIVLFGFLFYKMGYLDVDKTSLDSVNETVQATEGENGTQEVTINVKSNGYGPENVELKAGVPTKINFKAQGRGCTRQIYSEELGINSILREENNYIALEGLEPGIYQYTCGMGMFGGTITVK